VIIEYAEQHDIDMIVIGSRGLGDLKGMLLGSVSHKVAHLAECSCITVK
ncbi:MAG: universal stress protein, partial [Rhodospirillales bacterium]|nr:universal stress protein [Rhodospirillales bacterium]